MRIDPYFPCEAKLVRLLIFQPEVSLTSVKEDMEAARLQLKAYSDTLTELISKIGKSFTYRSLSLWLLFLVSHIYKTHKSSLHLKCQITKELRAF